jgi:hypothetical protein
MTTRPGLRHFVPKSDHGIYVGQQISSWVYILSVGLIIRIVMKDGLEQLPGKTIAAVVVDSQHGRVFLVFSDDTHFEFYHGPGLMNWTRAV